MKSALFLIAFSLVTVVHGHGSVHRPRHNLEPRTVGGYYQQPNGKATFTAYSGCSYPACGIVANGFSAAMSQRSFGAGGNQGAGDACGRCFKITGTYDPYSPQSTGEDWCGQSNSTPYNQFGAPVHFDLCEDSGSAKAFFGGTNIGALGGTYQEVSCTHWSGSEGQSLWNNACLKGKDTAYWPNHTGCGNVGSSP